MNKWKFDESVFKKCKTYVGIDDKHSAGQVTIIGGSKLFHGAPLMALTAASRLVSMVNFSSPDEDKAVADILKASLFNFIWVPFSDVNSYVSKSDSVLIGPGMMRSHVNEQGFVCDDEGEKTRKMCLDLFDKFPDAKWVIDGGALQVVSVSDIPKNAVVTPNKKEFEMLFGEKLRDDVDKRCEQILFLSKKYSLVLLTKDAVSIASDGEEVWTIEGGNDGLIKGGVGDVIAGLTVGLMAKNDSLFSVCGASFLVKKAAENLASERGLMFNSDDLVDMVPVVYNKIVSTR